MVSLINVALAKNDRLLLCGCRASCSWNDSAKQHLRVYPNFRESALHLRHILKPNDGSQGWPYFEFSSPRKYTTVDWFWIAHMQLWELWVSIFPGATEVRFEIYRNWRAEQNFLLNGKQVNSQFLIKHCFCSNLSC